MPLNTLEGFKEDGTIRKIIISHSQDVRTGL